MNEVVSDVPDHGSGGLDRCWLGQRMLNRCRLQQTPQLNPSLTVAPPGSPAVILIQLHCPYIISNHLCCRGRNFEQGQCRDKLGRKKKRLGIHQQRRNNVRLLSSYGVRVTQQKAPAMTGTIMPMSGEMNQQRESAPVALS
ncbi:hypothetical protein PBY51_018202 [Eleginops maclovinus]|uniref:Uncharacterized protein n=1 Tax=Eleginops maclovinus TaxID=56733 RepID=A0AAN7XEH3_ELEMC|nr:hypothetical protein PBY51_018202 [Eleginops maclovinus]